MSRFFDWRHSFSTTLAEKVPLRAGAIITEVTVTVRTAAAISEIRGYPSSLYRLCFARSAEKSEVTPSSLYEMALREAPKYQS